MKNIDSSLMHGVLLPTVACAYLSHFSLSGGESQRVAIAKLMLKQPSII